MKSIPPILLSISYIVLFLYCSLCRCQTCDRHAERRAGNVIQANIVAELDGSRVAAVLAADTKLDVRAGGLTELASHLNELAYANLVELCERIVLVDLLVVVRAEELAGAFSTLPGVDMGRVVAALAADAPTIQTVWTRAPRRVA